MSLQELGLIRKPANFVSSITDERGEELLYAGMPITDVFKDDIGMGGVISLLWFQRRLPTYACKFIEMCLMVTADQCVLGLWTRGGLFLERLLTPPP